MMTVAIFGESPLVEEYAALCLAKGMRVVARMNGGASEKDRPSRLPGRAKSITRPTRTVDLAIELTNTSVDAKRQNLVELDKVLPARVCILSSSVTVTVAEQSTWVRNAGRVVGIGALPSLLEGSLIELASSHTSSPEVIAQATGFVQMLDKESAMVKDSIGMVLPRILCMLANEAGFALMENIANREAIDTAMKLGTNYPHGPVEWIERIGVKQVHAVLASLNRSFAEDRYRISPLLQQAVV